MDIRVTEPHLEPNPALWGLFSDHRREHQELNRSIAAAGLDSGLLAVCCSSLIVYSQREGVLPGSSWCHPAPLHCKNASTAASAASTSDPMRTCRICTSCGETPHTPWQLFVEPYQTRITCLMAVRAPFSWASAEATTRKLPLLPASESSLTKPH